MTLIWVLVFMSFIVERAVEMVIRMFPALSNLDIKCFNVEMGLAFLLSLLLAYGGNLDLFSMFDVDFFVPFVGPALSALFMSGGSNVVHDIIEWVKSSKEVVKLEKRDLDY